MLARALRQSFAATLALSLLAPAAYAQNQPQWIFPGQTLPTDIGFSPLSAGSGPQVEVPLLPRDQFLIKDKGFALLNPAGDRSLEVRGPVLDGLNANLYYRLVTGMILKQSMQAMGMSAGQASRMVEAAKLAGQDFDKTPLADLGLLPQGLNDLYKNWDRPLSRMALLPYLILPLSIANDVSQFQHFSKGNIEDAANYPGAKTCRNMQTLAPLAQAQTRINLAQEKLDQLAHDLSQAKGLADQSNAELVRLTNMVKDQAARIEKDSACFSQIKERISRGGAMPAPACLSTAQQIFVEAKTLPQWEKFAAVNLKNDRGDFRVLQEATINLSEQEARLASLQATMQTLLDQKAKLVAEKNDSEFKLKQLQGDRDLQTAGEKKLNAEQDQLNSELHSLQEINHQLENNALANDETALKKAIAETPDRSQRIIQIKSRLPLILEEQAKVQNNLGAILVQVEFLDRALDTNRLAMASLDAQIGDAKAGLTKQVKDQEIAAKEANKTYLAATDQSNYSEYVLSILTKDLTEDSQIRDRNLSLLKAEEITLAKYKEQIKTAQSNSDSQSPALKAELSAAQNTIASYRDDKEMGWFLENDCVARASFDRDGTGIYLSRAAVSPNQADANQAGPNARVDAGKWGMFDMPYDDFKSSIQNGALLNLEQYIDVSVRAMIADYDSAAARMMGNQASNCSTASVNGGIGSTISGLLQSAFDIWNLGSSDKAKTEGFCVASSKGSDYAQTLKSLLVFKGSILDQTLPPELKSRPEDLIEREAVVALTNEVAILTGQVSASADDQSRREHLIKSLIKVLAYDYAEAATQAAVFDDSAAKYKFASQAPGQAKDVEALTVGSVQSIKALDGVRLYRQPIAQPENETGFLSMGDQVTILPLTEGSNLATQAGWTRVMVANEAFFMPLAALSKEPVVDIASDAKCPVRRLVKTLTNFNDAETTVTRFLPDLKTDVYKGGQFQMTRNNQATTVAQLDKVYIACELFSREGQRASPNRNMKYSDESGVDFSKVQGIRILEARLITGKTGEVRYVPVEEYGGFVHTWLPKRNRQIPRIILGPRIDPRTWTLIQ